MTLYQKLLHEAQEHICECIYDIVGEYVDDLHHELFNMEYYDNIDPSTDCGKEKAKALLEDMDSVFDAIGRVYTYEMEHFGEIYTDLSNPASIINMLWYIAGYELIYSIDFYDIVGNETYITNELADKLVTEYSNLTL